MAKLTTFHIRVDNGQPRTFEARDSRYSIAVMEAFGKLGLPYPCDVEIWLPDLVEEGYGPYFYRISDFIDVLGNHYCAPSVLTRLPVPAGRAALTQENPDV